MATKTERILSRLPGTFRALPPPTALHALASAFGGELQRAENALAEVMQAHWVGHADRGAQSVHDLKALAELYGLAPRAHPLPEETVEEFRARLISHVRTFLEGTATLGGVMRVAADSLGLSIEPELDGWWSRPDGDPVLARPRGDDAAALLFGVPAALARGRAATPASVRGPVLPADGADLRGGATLRLSLDGGEVRDVDCAAGADDASRVPLSSVAAAIDRAFGARVARDVDGRLTLRSPSTGQASTLEVHEVPGDDAAPVLLGLPARRCLGRAGVDARIAGRVQLPATMDLREHRFLRATVDGTRLAEVDCCAGEDPAAATPGQVADAINAALGPIASIVDGRLVLASTTPGAGGSLVIREAAARDAAARLLGDAPRSARGLDPAPSEAVGAAALPAEIDLSRVFAVRIGVDARRPVTVDCAGADPAATTPVEVAARLAAALAPGTARFDGLFLHVASGTAGPESTLEILPVTPEEDAGPLLFGLRPRVFHGEDAAPAVIHGTRDLAAGVDTRARGSLGVAVDGAAPVEVTLPRPVRRDDGGYGPVPTLTLARAINEAVGEWIAAVEADRLVLASNTRGTAASIELVPLEEREQRPFVTRAFVTGEAASVLLGVPAAAARGSGAERARIEGTVELRRGVDLRAARWLRLSVDGAPAVDVDCASHAGRPRLALPEEVCDAINAVFAPPDDGAAQVASVEGGRLVLTSRRAGAAALLRLEPPRARDARPLLLGREPGLWRGVEGRRVVFTGTADLSGGVDLSGARHLRLKVDGAEREADCAGADPADTALPEIVTAINTAFGRLVARSDGAHLVISSAGPQGHVDVLRAEAGPDAAPLLLGIAPPRSYHGQPPERATVEGTTTLAGPLDLSVGRFLRLAIDGGAPVDVDCAARAADPAAVSPVDVADAIEDVLGPGTAEIAGGRLVLKTRSMGSGARIELLVFSRDDAREALFGEAPAEARGRAPAPAEIVGKVDLRGGADLSSGRTLRVRVDGGRARDVDVAGVLVGSTEADEVSDAINGVLPGLASLTADGQLRLRSPTEGEASALEVLPVRVLEIVEYPAEAVADVPRELRHGGRTEVANDGAHESDAVLELHAPRGASGPALANPAAGARIRYLGALGAGDTLRLSRDADMGVRGELSRGGGPFGPVPPQDLLAGSAAAQVRAPFDGVRRLARGRPGEPAAIRLDDPWQPRVAALRERTPASPHGLEVQVAEHALPAPSAPPVSPAASVTLHGRVAADGARHVLVDRDGGQLAVLLRGTSGGPVRHLGRVVAAEGELHASAGGAPVLVARRIDRLFDVVVRERAPGTASESFHAVSIGSGAEDGLARRVVAGAGRSQLVLAVDEDKGALLRLARGRAEWVYTECHGPRFDLADFDEPGETEVLRSRFPGVSCVEMGIHDISRFARAEDDPGAAVLAAGPGAAPPVSLVLRWTRHRPGAFELRLPAVLPDYFGARLDDGRLGIGAPPPPPGGPVDPNAGREAYGGVVTEPAEDPDYFVTRLAASGLVSVSVVPRAPIGWRAIPIPFRRPRVLRLSGGRDDRPARIYITDPDVPVVFEVLAKGGGGGAAAAGAWGNLIEIGVGPWVPDDGVPGVDPPVPGRFLVTVGYAGARVEGARESARGGGSAPPPAPVGVLDARAAGVAARVIRERAEFAAPESDQHLREEPA